MHAADFDYPLPKDLIAQKPVEPRDSARLLVARRADGSLEDRTFRDLSDLIPAGDVLVLNDTKVFPARILGRKAGTGGKVDALLLSPTEEASVWRCLVQPAPKEGVSYEFAEGVTATFHGRDREGIALLRFENTEDLAAFAHRNGTMPLPPYIKREAGPEDNDRYQTVYADRTKEGAVAAPTAGLHFTPALLEKIRDKGIEIERVTLHVGYGTFKPVEDPENHRMHAEAFEMTPEVAERLNQAKAERRKIWAVGTTALRVLETCVQKKRIIPGKGETDLYIREPFRFEAADRLITNFHLPKTTLLFLVSAFAGEALRKKAYEHAMREKYRFYSYGDSMAII